MRYRDSKTGAGKISRKQFRKEQKDRARGKKRKQPENRHEEEISPAKKPKNADNQSKKKTKTMKKLSIREKKDLKEDMSFRSMVQNYKNRMTSLYTDNHKKWHEY